MTKDKFLEGVNNNDLCHRILLIEALQLTAGKVIEFGSGHGSTPYLRKYCVESDREFQSFDNNKEWADATGATMVPDANWSGLQLTNIDVLFVDHAPGEDRQVQIEKYKDSAKIIVIHDTEPPADHGYNTRRLYPAFKYWVEVRTNGAWATMVSNHIDLSPCVHETKCVNGSNGETYKIVNAK